MSTKKVVKKAMTTEEPVTEPEQKTIKQGFTVGVLEDGELVFNIHGNPGIIELQGLVVFASKVADAKFKDQLNIDDVAILKSLGHLHQKIDSLEVLETSEDAGKTKQ